MGDYKAPEHRLSWSCKHFWDGPFAGGGKWCEAPLSHGLYLRYQTGWKSPDIGSIARDVPTDEKHILTHVALLTDKIVAKTGNDFYYVIAFEDDGHGGNYQRIFGPLDETMFAAQAPETKPNWMAIRTP